jgi:3-hydroxyisobutyrate dehydrogenase
MDVGFIGLGRMGRGMALNLLKNAQGVTLHVLDRSAEAMRVLVEAGARPAQDVADIAGRVDVLFTSLPGPAEVEAVVLGADGVAAHMRQGLALFDLSTSSRALAIRLDEALQRKGGAALDAPVSGGPAGAASGDLALWVGGDRAVYDRYEPLLRAFADKARYVGGVGAGTVTKLAHNMTGFLLFASMAETFSLGVKGGVDPLELWEAMRLGVVGKRKPLDLLVPQFLPGRYEPPAFALELATKDVRLANALAQELGVPMRLSSLVLQEMTEALARGFGHQDSRAFMKLQLERAGVEVAVDEQRLQAAVKAAQDGASK